jgi:hypothetical protein
MRNVTTIIAASHQNAQLRVDMRSVRATGGTIIRKVLTGLAGSIDFVMRSAVTLFWSLTKSTKAKNTLLNFTSDEFNWFSEKTTRPWEIDDEYGIGTKVAFTT